jgi:hypothetical protein
MLSGSKKTDSFVNCVMLLLLSDLEKRRPKMKTQRHYLFIFKARAPEASKLVHKTDTDTDTERESQSFSSGVVGWVLVLLFSFVFFWF